MSGVDSYAVIGMAHSDGPFSSASARETHETQSSSAAASRISSHRCGNAAVLTQTQSPCSSLSPQFFGVRAVPGLKRRSSAASLTLPFTYGMKKKKSKTAKVMKSIMAIDIVAREIYPVFEVPIDLQKLANITTDFDVSDIQREIVLMTGVK